jgi:hypothetical protein
MRAVEALRANSRVHTEESSAFAWRSYDAPVVQEDSRLARVLAQPNQEAKNVPSK